VDNEEFKNDLDSTLRPQERNAVCVPGVTHFIKDVLFKNTTAPARRRW